MYKTWLILLCMLLTFTVAKSQSLKKDFPKSLSVEISNPLNISRDNAMVVVSADQLKTKYKGFNTHGFIVMDGDKEIASQYNKNDVHTMGIVFVLDKLGPLEKRVLQIRYNPKGNIQRTYTKRTQAELSHKTGGRWVNREYIEGTFKNVDYLRVPPEHKDHSWFLRYEGPGWESDKVGYRFYLDQRNATDVFGKKTTDMVLQNVGQDGFDSYHEMHHWGMDVMKVGKTLGIGSIGALENEKAIRVEKTDSVTCSIAENGNVYSTIVTNYYGWQHNAGKTSLKSTLGIHAGSRLTHQVLDITGDATHLCTGIGKDKNAVLITSKGDKAQFGYLATYGKQSLNNDELGLAIFFKADNGELTQDEYNHIVNLQAVDGKIQYYFLAAWIEEPDGIKTQQQFEAYLNQVAIELANPIKAILK